MRAYRVPSAEKVVLSNEKGAVLSLGDKMKTIGALLLAICCLTVGCETLKGGKGELCYWIDGIGKVCVIYANGEFSFTASVVPAIRTQVTNELEERGFHERK